MTHKISRRNVLAGGAALLSMSALGPAFAQEARLRVLWWGSQARADRTNKVNQLFQEQNAGVAINGEFLGWSDYWPRLATQVAGGQTPHKKKKAKTKKGQNSPRRAPPPPPP